MGGCQGGDGRPNVPRPTRPLQPPLSGEDCFYYSDNKRDPSLKEGGAGVSLVPRRLRHVSMACLSSRMMFPDHNKKIFADRRRELRRNQTDAEARLWHFLRNRRLHGLKFHRQYGIGRYILDFYCFDIKLAIELDGGQHAAPSQAAYDDERTAYLASLGIKVLRYWNHDMVERHESVLEEIHEIIKAVLP